ncbi:hypothetical protein IFM89_020643 [Coptis chinensis]|uniref:Fe2OG dioxygenase domain-containing protein n=1 Tax=Coptis chinensis TaxID=261450 RepID=A0A835ICT4_9MAGN|nr:hypothetical protein IFM89_020643 [Coptis chinensis]
MGTNFLTRQNIWAEPSLTRSEYSRYYKAQNERKTSLLFGYRMGERGDDAKKLKWPAIKQKKSLQITHLKDAHLFTVPNFFTSAESRAFVEVAESIGFTHQGSLGPLKGEAYRDNDRIAVNDPVLAETIWESGLKKLFADITIRNKVAVGLNPNIRFYRYKVGQRFGRHIDESVDLGDGCRTHYTLLIYLSGGAKESGKTLVGGETVFYGSRRGVVAEVAPIEGMALLHIHGEKCMLHEARNVTKGVKTNSSAIPLEESKGVNVEVID